MELLKVAVVQQDIIWENARANLKRLDTLLAELDDTVDMVVLPEMFHSGFTMSPENVAQQESGEVLVWMKELAVKKQFCLIGSVVYNGEDGFNNRLFVYFPDGTHQYYNKRHLFSIGGENNNYCKGDKRLVFEYKGWRICPLICYDLRFPVWSRNDVEYDILIYVANWPKSRRQVWTTLLQARAIENQSYVLGVNRVGTDFANDYSGDTVVLNAKGESELKLKPDVETLGIALLNKIELAAFREKFPVWKDRDDFEIIND